MTFDKVKNIIVETLNLKDADQVTMDSHLVDDLGADSLDAAEIVMSIEDEFGIAVDDDAANTIKYVKDLVAAIDAALNK